MTQLLPLVEFIQEKQISLTKLWAYILDKKVQLYFRLKEDTPIEAFLMGDSQSEYERIRTETGFPQEVSIEDHQDLLNLKIDGSSQIREIGKVTLVFGSELLDCSCMLQTPIEVNFNALMISTIDAKKLLPTKTPNKADDLNPEPPQETTEKTRDSALSQLDNNLTLILGVVLLQYLKTKEGSNHLKSNYEDFTKSLNFKELKKTSLFKSLKSITNDFELGPKGVTNYTLDKYLGYALEELNFKTSKSER